MKKSKTGWLLFAAVVIFLVAMGVFQIIKVNRKYPQRVVYTYDKENPYIENNTCYEFDEVRVLSPKKFEEEFCKKEIWTLFREHDEDGNEIAGSYKEGYYIIILVSMKALEDKTIFTMNRVVQFHLETENCDLNPTYDNINKNKDTGVMQKKGGTQDARLVFFVSRSSVTKKGDKNIKTGKAQYDLVYCDEARKQIIHLGKGQVEE